MSQWWDNAEQGRAARYAHDPDDRPTLAECEQDERDIQAMRAQYAEAADSEASYATQRARDILAELRAAVEAAKQEH